MELWQVRKVKKILTICCMLAWSVIRGEDVDGSYLSWSQNCFEEVNWQPPCGIGEDEGGGGPGVCECQGHGVAHIETDEMGKPIGWEQQEHQCSAGGGLWRWEDEKKKLARCFAGQQLQHPIDEELAEDQTSAGDAEDDSSSFKPQSIIQSGGVLQRPARRKRKLGKGREGKEGEKVESWRSRHCDNACNSVSKYSYQVTVHTLEWWGDQWHLGGDDGGRGEWCFHGGM